MPTHITVASRGSDRITTSRAPGAPLHSKPTSKPPRSSADSRQHEVTSSLGENVTAPHRSAIARRNGLGSHDDDLACAKDLSELHDDESDRSATRYDHRLASDCARCAAGNALPHRQARKVHRPRGTRFPAACSRSAQRRPPARRIRRRPGFPVVACSDSCDPDLPGSGSSLHRQHEIQRYSVTGSDPRYAGAGLNDGAREFVAERDGQPESERLCSCGV
jgi:hypothetical protein